ncbi:MAG: sodium:calcium antiporter [Chloroflexi bacterium]|nr:sodium:calcium antiporter [Chloroflexota bacterium]
MKNWGLVFGAMGVAIPWLVLRASGYHGDPISTAALSGMAILGAAFLLAWAAEVAQLDVSQALALALLSLIAILPEYSVDMYFAWKAAQDPSYGSFAIANMTGANRLLIGVGWSLIVILHWWRRRARSLELDRSHIIELSVLAVATIYAFLVALKGTLSVIDTGFLVGLFVVYIIVVSRLPNDEPELMGPALSIAALPKLRRRIVTFALFAFAGIAIFLSAEPFSEGLIETGQILGVEEFLLVQWLAPLASEAPEFVIAALFALRGHPGMALRAMIASKVNQWTLLVGMLPLVYGIGMGQPSPLALDDRQTQEIVLTAAQSVFAVIILGHFRMTVRDAVVLLTLFALQLVFPSSAGRYAFAAGYIALALWLTIGDTERRNVILRAPIRLAKALGQRPLE